MMEFMRKRQGAISIFLVIVLLPMLSVASIFVDISRIQLAQSMAESAGDLTLNTALTNYDTELKNIYGLFATAQDMDELMQSLEDYYRDSIVAAGVDEVDADDYVGQVMSYLKTTTGTDDLMNIQLSGFEVSVPTGGNLANPAIMKSQIVEFMKYRAPLSLGTSFIEALNMMKNLSKQTAMVEDKTDFYEEYQSVLSMLEDAWWQLELYQYSDAKLNGNVNFGFPNGSYLGDHAAQMDSYASTGKDSAWKDIVSKTVKYLYDYTHFKRLIGEITLQYTCPECGKVNEESRSSCASCGGALDQTAAGKAWTINLSGTKTTIKKTYTEDDPATTDDVLEALNGLYTAIHAVDQYTTGSNNAVYKLVMEETTTSSAEAAKIYAVCQFNQSLETSSNYLKAVKTLLEQLVLLQSAVETCDADELAKIKVIRTTENGKIQWELGGSDLLASIAQGQITAHYNLDTGGYLDMYNKVVQRVNGFYDSAESTYNDAMSSVNEKLDEIRDYAADFDAFVGKKIDNLTKAIQLLEKVKTEITSPTSEYSKKLSAWESSTKALSDDSMGQSSQAEIDELKEIITADRLDKLITRLKAAQTTMQSIRDEIAKYKFSGTAWKDIPDGSKFYKVISMISQWDGRIKAVKVTADSSYDTIITEITGAVQKGSIKADWGDSEANPSLTKQQRDLYTWMVNNYYTGEKTYHIDTSKPEKTNSKDSDLEDTSKQLKNEADKQGATKEEEASTQVEADISAYIKEKVLPSSQWAETENAIAQGKVETDADTMMASSGSSGSDNILTSLLDMASNMGTDLRDNLYVSEYIMSMFSYDTIEAETYLAKDGNSFGNYEAFYTKTADGSWETTAGFEEYVAQMTTLTNNTISPNMNYMYGGEVEYILYGADGTKDVYGTIFGIRFALNLVYAYTDATITNSTLSAATALFGTPPLTPLIPLAQAAMIIGLAIAESAYDLVQLRQGEEVPLMKNNQTWVMSPAGLAKEVKEELVELSTSAAKKAVDKGYQLLNDAISMTAEELQTLIDDTEGGLQSLVDATTETITSQFENYANEAIQQVVNLCNNANQEAMLKATGVDFGSTEEKVQSVISGLNAWLQEQKAVDPAVIYEVKKTAVEYLTANGGAKITEIFDQLEAQRTAVSGDAAVEKLNSLLDRLFLGITGKIKSLINSGTSILGQAVTEAEKELKDAAKQGAEALKTALTNKIGDAFGAIPTAGGGTSTATTNTLSSLLSWSYSDYLRIFVVIGLFANEDLMLLRISDVIQMNMQNKNNEFAVITTTETKEVTKSRFFGLWKYTTTEEVETNTVNTNAFSMSKAYTYITIDATLQVKPLLMTMPFMADTVENQLSGTKWYEITYTGTLGY